MFKNLTLRAVLTVGIGLIVSGSVGARSLPVDENGPKGPIRARQPHQPTVLPCTTWARLALSVTNYGTFGTGVVGLFRDRRPTVSPTKLSNRVSIQKDRTLSIASPALSGSGQSKVKILWSRWERTDGCNSVKCSHTTSPSQPQDVMKTRSIIDPTKPKGTNWQSPSRI